ncbi:MAG: pyruvate, phosphate dikinase [Bacteroidales bacterium]|nr:pyruvate, phosphate dikinase [Bacteroidales bacterium]
MPFKVKEILLIANLYDAYSIEKEGRFTEHILGEYHQLNLTAMPRITGVSNEDEAFYELEHKHFDLIILMVGVDKKTPLLLSTKIKEKQNYIPIYLLLNNNSDISYFENEKERISSIDKIFIWNGDSKVFFAMVKQLEDKVNIDNDTKIGMVRVILLVEDSAKYYSRYLPMLYQIVLEQTKHLIEDVNTDELYKVLKLRARPKILLASNYEEAITLFNTYKDNMLCVISDVQFPKNGKMCKTSGFELISYVKEQIPNIATLLQSSDSENSKKAYEIKSNFIDKNSDSLNQDIKGFINYYLGFGNFVYRNSKGGQIAVAKSMREFEQSLKTIPEESMLYHATKNHFSLWLMARGEINIAKIINPLKVADFKDVTELRNFLINAIKQFRNEKDKGKIVQFEEAAIVEESNIVSLSSGALGGKGRGLAFVNTLIYNFNFSSLLPLINIKTPRTAIIGTDEFDIFLQKNDLANKLYIEKNYDSVKLDFVKGELSYNLVKKLKVFLKLIDKPLAIRSSSLFEDSLMQPFSGIFETYLLPNNHPDIEVRLQQVMDAIKLVYASIFSNNARLYFEAIDYKIEEEKMAVVIQEVVGNAYENTYYPHISGTAQSHNYYPVSHMKPEEGFAVAAVGLGMYVVEGDKTFRFSPKYPQIDIVSPKDLYKSSQVYFFAVDLNKQNLDLLEGEEAGLIKLDISEAEKHGTLKHCASVYDADSDRIIPGIDQYGPRVVNFSNILKYDYIPMAETISAILDIVKEALGSPVEIEFAVDLNRNNNQLPAFYLLQIKPLVGNEDDYNIDLESVNHEKVLLFTERSMGNGKIDYLTDVIFADPDKFDHLRTEEMAQEIEKLNSEMLRKGKKYLLIGPGRWGTRDKFIGIPVVWSQISNAKVIVEMSLEDFPLDASLGSHFFHNVTSMNVGYFSIQHSSKIDKINWDVIKKQEVIQKTEFFTHVKFKKPFIIVMDGKKRLSVISTGE